MARTEDFQQLAKDIARHIVGATPSYVSQEDIPAPVHEEAKTEHGDNIKKYYEENVLLHQPYIRDQKVTINDMLVQARAKLGENILVRRFVRYELGK